MDAIQTHGPTVLLVKAVSLPFRHLIRTILQTIIPYPYSDTLLYQSITINN